MQEETPMKERNERGVGVDTSPRAGIATRRRRSSYHTRKAERASLRLEIEALRTRVRELEMGRFHAGNGGLNGSLGTTARLTDAIQHSHRALAGAESLLARYKVSWEVNPLETFIRLPADPEDRQQILLAHKPLKLERATEFMIERARFLDLRHQHRSIETFARGNGDYVAVVCDVTPFYGSHSVARVFDEFRYYISTQDIAITETLGVLTVNQTDDGVDFSRMQARLLSCVAPNVEVESNLAKFSDLLKDERLPGGHYAIATLDFVNEDDLFPYNTSRLRRDVSAAALIMNYPLHPDRPNGPTLVTMARWAYVRLHAPGFQVTLDDEARARSLVEQWDSVMPKVMQERLARSSHGGSS